MDTFFILAVCGFAAAFCGRFFSPSAAVFLSPIAFAGGCPCKGSASGKSAPCISAQSSLRSNSLISGGALTSRFTSCSVSPSRSHSGFLQLAKQLIRMRGRVFFKGFGQLSHYCAGFLEILQGLLECMDDVHDKGHFPGVTTSVCGSVTKGRQREGVGPAFSL